MKAQNIAESSNFHSLKLGKSCYDHLYVVCVIAYAIFTKLALCLLDEIPFLRFMFIRTSF